MNEDDVLIASLIKTSKKDELTGEKRQEQVELLSVGDVVSLEEDFECEGLLVRDQFCNELGELSQSVSEKIMLRVVDVAYVFAEVYEVDYSEKTKVKLKIYL